MSKGYLMNAAGMRIWNESREVFNTASGRLVNFLPTPNTYSFNAAFPDASKGKIGMWSWRAAWSPPGAPNVYGYHVVGAAVVGARPQEWNNTIVLGDAPVGANIFLGRVLLTRTVNPTHSWMGQTLAAPAFAGSWVPLNGSMIVEEGFGLSRALSIYVANGTPAAPGPAGKLVAYLQHSVSGKCGGFRSWGNQPSDVVSGVLTGGQNAWLGGSSTTAQPVYWNNASPYRRQTSGTTFSGSWVSIPHTMHKWDGSQPPTYLDPTNYASTYSVQVVGRFGRHA